MTTIDVSTDNNNFTELVNKVTNTGERILIERQGQEIAAIITYAELKQLYPSSLNGLPSAKV